MSAGIAAGAGASRRVLALRIPGATWFVYLAGFLLVDVSVLGLIHRSVTTTAPSALTAADWISIGVAGIYVLLLSATLATLEQARISAAAASRSAEAAVLVLRQARAEAKSTFIVVSQRSARRAREIVQLPDGMPNPHVHFGRDELALVEALQRDLEDARPHALRLDSGLAGDLEAVSPSLDSLASNVRNHLNHHHPPGRDCAPCSRSSAELRRVLDALDTVDRRATAL